MKIKYIILLLLILILGSIFRFTALSSNPIGVFRDEAEKGYTAYSIMKTGGYLAIDPSVDENNIYFKKFPLLINVYGVYTSAIYQYFDIPFLYLFGLNEASLRLPAALIGLLTIIVTFLFCSRFLSVQTALLASFLLAVSPWHIIFSRWAQQGIFLPSFMTIGIFSLIAGLEKKEKYPKLLIVLSAIPFSLAFYSYDIGRAYIPIILIGIFLIYYKKILENKKSFLFFLILLIITSFPVIYFTLFHSQQSAARFSRISIFSDKSGIIGTTLLFIKNYLLHYSPQFLFFNGDAELRHGVRNFGLLHWFEIPMLFLGLFALIKKRDRFSLLILYWFLTFPIPASLTKEGIPHALRSITGLPVVHIISAIGGMYFYDKIKAIHKKEIILKKIPLNLIPKPNFIIVLFVSVVILCLLLFSIDLFMLYPSYSALNWQYGVKESIGFCQPYIQQGYNVYVTGYITQAPYLYLFYTKYPPEEFKITRFGEFPYKFLPYGLNIEKQISRIKSGKTLIVTFPGEIQNKSAEKVIFAPLNILNKELFPTLMIYKYE